MDLLALMEEQDPDEVRARLAQRQAETLEAYRAKAEEGGVPANKRPF